MQIKWVTKRERYLCIVEGYGAVDWYKSFKKPRFTRSPLSSLFPSTLSSRQLLIYNSIASSFDTMSLPGRVLRPPTSCSSRLARTSLRAVSPPTPLPRLTALQRSLHQTYCSQQAIVSGASSGQTQSRSISSSEFDPPAQISKINTHYCREPQLVVIEGYGILQGQMDPSRLLTKYLNIPFASVQDPIKHAVAPESWAGIRDATVLGVQFSHTLPIALSPLGQCVPKRYNMPTA
ncbi:hypothetical protein BC939DRAFT_114394 [Gamsiella multidivaricata]|uniref:uncharacterized protein n=1 Tax=Gamsiella multidivaricata TaxID=101098 RepID=UPI00222050DC|nr:uncharacterized protein BC939DRAFT_114394 [Gamsiella multidivaricata]KAI7826613.1 hypothetical protein BC939DRAFT_114394 [Gamsiella multidivaricata]